MQSCNIIMHGRISIEFTSQQMTILQATSFMELIPEFYDYSNPEFLENRLGLNVCASSEGRTLLLTILKIQFQI